MNLYDRYLIRKFLGAFFGLLAMIMVIVLIVDFVEKMDMIIEKKPPISDLIFRYYFNLLPYYGSLLAPICIFLAVIFFTSRLAQRTEFIPALSSGVNFYRIAATYLGVAAVLTLLAFVVKGYAVPQSIEERMDFEYKYFSPKSVSSNYNVHKKVAKDTYVTIGYYDRRAMTAHRFILEQVANGDIVRKLWATHAKWNDTTHRWLLDEVHIRQIGPRQEQLTYRPTLDTTFQLTHGDIFVIENKEESFSNSALDGYIALEELRGSDILHQLYEERYRRYSDPFAILVLTLIGFAISSQKRRGGIALQIGVGIMICFFYIILLIVGTGLSGDRFPLWLAVWLPNIIFSGVALVALRLAPK